MFREPLYPDGSLQEFSDYLTSVKQWLDSPNPHTIYEAQLDCQNSQSPLSWLSFSAGKGLLLAGRLENKEQAKAVAELARLLGWPLIADLQSQLHGHPIAIKHHDLLLAQQGGKDLFSEADRVLQVGGHLISKRLDRFLSHGQWQHYWMLGQEFRRMDTGHCQTYRMVGSVEETCRRLSDEIRSKNTDSDLKAINIWKERIDGLSDIISTTVSRLDDDGRVTERWLGAHLLRFLSADDSLFVGNSLPVRLLDMFSLSHARQVYANRGASGIDGLIATAAGCAEGSQKPLLAVVGDLSFLHDLNSLQLVRAVSTPMALLVINNDGGGIFRLLPVDGEQSSAITYFQTPHGLDAQMAARMFGIPYMNPTGCREVEAAVSQALDSSGCTLIEVKTKPGEAAEQIRQAISLLETL
jgi:2-succinyl-5-enolpyruvyl-6-hydroxy-3-cyclohexene-1-carboxylate synthase